MNILKNMKIVDITKLIILVIVVVVVSSYTTSCFNKTELEEYIENFEKFKEDAELTTEYADSLVLVLQERDVEIGQLEDTMVVIRVKLQENERLLDNVTAQRDAARSAITDSMFNQTPIPVLKYIGTLEQENKVLREVNIDLIRLNNVSESTILLLGRQVDDATLRGDSLQFIVNNIPPPPPDPTKILGFIPKPTPTQAVIGGTVVGIFIDAFVINRGR